MLLRPGPIVLCCLLAAFMPVASAQELPRKQFEIRVEETGTRLGRAAIRSTLPLNRRYAELEDAEKAMVRADYEGMPAGDEPPFPAHGLLPIFNDINEAMNKYRFFGTLTAVADVDGDGKVRHVDVFGNVDRTVASFVTRVLFAAPFKPGVCAGKPCNMQYMLRMNFTL
jgi:hypothetical protein